MFYFRQSYLFLPIDWIIVDVLDSRRYVAQPARNFASRFKSFDCWENNMCRGIVVGSRVRFVPDCEPKWLDIEMYNRTRLDVIAVRAGWVTVRTMCGTVRKMRTPEFREWYLTDTDDAAAVHVWVSGFRLAYADRTAAIIDYIRSGFDLGVMVNRQFATMRGE